VSYTCLLSKTSYLGVFLIRPGLSNFLKEIEALYELHIYTMGTRNYAEAVTKEIDKTGSLFKERILSRDESGSKYY
jgi:RNA polymerase II subunit A-like phosphatase